MKYHILTADRKEVKAKLEELTGKKAVYAGTPSFAFILDGITIGRDYVAEEGGEYEAILQKLMEGGFIEAIDDPEKDNGSEAETIESNDEAEKDNDSEAESIESHTDFEKDSDSEAETSETANDTLADVERAEPLKAEFSFPLSQHRPESICNLIFTIYSKGNLLNKSTGGDFFVSETLKDQLKAGKFRTNMDVISILEEAGAEDLRGISFTDTTYSFTGFPKTDNTEKIRAWMKLSAAIHQAAIKRRRIHPKRSEETNEKFAFRTWLTRIGMNGADLKAERQVFYQNLSGHTAFRTQADADRWKKRQAEKRAELKAEQGQDVPATESEPTGIDTDGRMMAEA